MLFTGLYPMWHYHYAVELNYIEEHLAKGDKVTLLYCKADQSCCEANPAKKLAYCLRCMGIQQHGESLLSSDIISAPLITDRFLKATPASGKTEFNEVEDLLNFKIDSFEIGQAVYSSLVDRTLHINPNINENKFIINNLILDSYRVYMSAMSYLETNSFELVYIFNGRYTAARPWVHACQKHSVKYYTHEKVSSPDRPMKWSCDLPHNPAKYPERIIDFWNKSHDDANVRDQAHNFFQERPEGQMTGWISFVDKQQQSLLPEEWDKNNKNIVIFTSTEWEFVSIKEVVENAPFGTQEEAYLSLIKESQKFEKNIRYYIRVHPNSFNDKGRWWENDAFKELPNCTIIKPESKVSTYSLLENCDFAITYLSTIGIEATYWGKPSISLAQAFYYGLDAVYEPKNINELVELVTSVLPPKPQINALKFGAFMRCGGDLLIHSKALNYYTLTFKDQILEARQEVHEWLGECEKRKEVTGWQKWFQDRKDKKRFDQIIKECNGNLAAISVK